MKKSRLLGLALGLLALPLAAGAQTAKTVPYNSAVCKSGTMDSEWTFSSDWSTYNNMVYTVNNQAHDAWAVSPLVHLEAGRTYNVSVMLAPYWQKTGCSETVSLHYGKTLDETYKSSACWSKTFNDADNPTLLPYDFSFKAAESGDFYLGFRDFTASDAVSCGLCIGNFSITGGAYEPGADPGENPSVEQADEYHPILLVKDGFDVFTYTLKNENGPLGNSGYWEDINKNFRGKVSELGSTVNLYSLKINDKFEQEFGFTLNTSNQGTYTPQLYKTSSSEAQKVYSISMRASGAQHHTRMCLSMPEGKALSSVKLYLCGATEDQLAKLRFYDSDGLDITGNGVSIEKDGTDLKSLSWTAPDCTKTHTVYYVYDGNKVMRTYRFDMELVDYVAPAVEGTLEFEITPKANTLNAGDVTPGKNNTLSNITLTFAAPEEGEESIDVAYNEGEATLCYGETVVMTWNADNIANIVVDNSAETPTVKLTGITAEMILNPGEYTLTIPEGFVIRGEEISVSAIKVMKLTAPVETDLAVVASPARNLDYGTKVTEVRIGNSQGLSQAVLTDGFSLEVRTTKYGREDVRIENGQIVCALRNPIEKSGPFYITLNASSIAWKKADGTYAYNQEIYRQEYRINEAALLLEVTPVDDYSVKLTWTNPDGNFTDGIVRIGSTSQALDSGQLTSAADQEATIVVDEKGWKDLQVILYEGTTLAAQSPAVDHYFGEAEELESSITLVAKDWLQKGSWVIAPRCSFENDKAYDIRVWGHDNEAESCIFEIRLGAAPDPDSMTSYGTVTTVGSDAALLCVLAMEKEAPTPYTSDQLTQIESGNLYMAVMPLSTTGTVDKLFLGHNPVKVEEILTLGETETYYTLQGVKVANPDRGAYILVRNGKAVKIMR